MSLELRTEHLCAGYDGSAVLQDVSIHVGEGELVALIGANGAGKTTLMRAITGLIQPSAGSVRFDVADITYLPTHQRVEAGIALSPEGRQMFANLSVEKSLLLGSFSRRARPHRAERMEYVYSLFPRLKERRRQKSGLLSGGEQQMLAIGRALMSCPRILLLDEPSLGLAPVVMLSVLEAITRIAASGTGVLLVEQNVRAALGCASRVYVLAEGSISMTGEAAEMLADEKFLHAFLGHEAAGH